jgi:hypothetical protein
MKLCLSLITLPGAFPNAAANDLPLMALGDLIGSWKNIVQYPAAFGFGVSRHTGERGLKNSTIPAGIPLTISQEYPSSGSKKARPSKGSSSTRM